MFTKMANRILKVIQNVSLIHYLGLNETHFIRLSESAQTKNKFIMNYEDVYNLMKETYQSELKVNDHCRISH